MLRLGGSLGKLTKSCLRDEQRTSRDALHKDHKPEVGASPGVVVPVAI